MDPLSITAAVLSVSTTCYSTATFLHDVRCKYKDAPMTITSLCSETTVVNASLSHLQTLILQKDDLQRVLHGRPDLASALDCSMIGCMMLLSCLNDEIARVTRTTQGGNVSWRGRASLVWNHDKLRQLLADLRGQQTALGTLVNLFQVNSLARIQDLLERNKITFEETVERTRTLREKNPVIKIPESIYSNEPERNDNLFSIRASDTFSAHSGWQPSEVEFIFDDEVVNSQAYRRLLAKAIDKPKTLPDSSSGSVHYSASDDEAGTEENQEELQDHAPRGGVDTTDITSAAPTGVSCLDSSTAGHDRLMEAALVTSNPNNGYQKRDRPPNLDGRLPPRGATRSPKSASPTGLLGPSSRGVNSSAASPGLVVARDANGRMNRPKAREGRSKAATLASKEDGKLDLWKPPNSSKDGGELDLWQPSTSSPGQSKASRARRDRTPSPQIGRDPPDAGRTNTIRLLAIRERESELRQGVVFTCARPAARFATSISGGNALNAATASQRATKLRRNQSSSSLVRAIKLAALRSYSHLNQSPRELRLRFPIKGRVVDDSDSSTDSSVSSSED